MLIMAYGGCLSYLTIIKDTLPILLGVENGDVGMERSILTVSTMAVILPISMQRVSCVSLDAVDANGNALLESPVLLSGASVKAVQSSNGEVYTKAPKEKTEDGYSESFPETVEGLREYQSIQQHIRGGLVGEGTETGNNDVADSMALEKWRQDMRGSALAGFQLAMRAGPLCEEPVRGVAVVLESVEIAVTEESCGSYKAAKDLTGGMVVAALRSGIRCALL